MISLAELRAEALSIVDGVHPGEALDELTAALIGLAVRASVTSLDLAGTEIYVNRALDHGATAAQVHETLVLVSGLGVHTLMEGSPLLARVLLQRGDLRELPSLDEERRRLWNEFVGDDAYWERMNRCNPGFLDALIRLSPQAFEAFFQYCAVPWKSAALRGVTKELIAMSVDAAPSHRYLPGMRLHLGNALKLGAGRVAILGALDVAAEAPLHQGVG